MKSIRSAVVGCGIVGQQQHIPALELNPQADLVALCDTDSDRLKEASAGTGISTYRDVEQMLSAETLDSVHVCTPPQTRVPVARQVAPEGVSILFEKPLAATTDAAATLQKLADEHDVTMGVVHNKLFTPHYREARRRVGAGDIGDIVAATMLFGEDTDPSHSPRGDWVFDLPGGEIGEGLPHQAYLPLAFVDGLGEVSCVSKQQFRDLDRVDFDGAAIEATDRGGRRLVTIRVLTNSTMQDVLIVNGTKGQMTIDHARKGVFTNRRRGVTAKELVTDSLGHAGQLTWNVATTAAGFAKRLAYRKFGDERSEASNGHYVLIREYLEALQTGGPPPVTLQEGYDTIRLMEALE